MLTAEQIESKAPKKINSSFEARDMANPKFQQKCFWPWVLNIPQCACYVQWGDLCPAFGVDLARGPLPPVFVHVQVFSYLSSLGMDPPIIEHGHGIPQVLLPQVHIFKAQQRGRQMHSASAATAQCSATLLKGTRQLPGARKQPQLAGCIVFMSN